MTDSEIHTDKITKQILLDSLVATLEAHCTDTTGCYLGNPEEIRALLSSVVDRIQPGDMINRCIECGQDMGQSNPRQYCAKTYCAERT